MNIHRSLFGIACRAAAFSFLMAGTALLAQATSAASAVKAPVLLASESAPAGLALASQQQLVLYGRRSAPTPIPQPASISSAATSSRRRAAATAGPTTPAATPTKTAPRSTPSWPAWASPSPIGNTHKYETPSYGFQFGGGRNFNKVYRPAAAVRLRPLRPAGRHARQPDLSLRLRLHLHQIANGYYAASPASTATTTSGRSPSTPPSLFPPKARWAPTRFSAAASITRSPTSPSPRSENTAIYYCCDSTRRTKHRPLHQQRSRCEWRLRSHLQVLQVLQRAVLHGSAVCLHPQLAALSDTPPANVATDHLQRLRRLSRRTATAPPTSR